MRRSFIAIAPILIASGCVRASDTVTVAASDGTGIVACWPRYPTDEFSCGAGLCVRPSAARDGTVILHGAAAEDAVLRSVRIIPPEQREEPSWELTVPRCVPGARFAINGRALGRPVVVRLGWETLDGRRHGTMDAATGGAQALAEGSR